MQKIAMSVIAAVMLLCAASVSWAVEQNATGTYLYNANTETLDITIVTSSFVCDGPVKDDIYHMEEVSITASWLTWTEIEDGQREVMSWSRVSAEPDGLVGEWFHSEDGTGETLRFLADGSVEVVGPDSSTCPEGTGAHSASGTYMYDPTKTTEQLSVEFVTSDFSCAGPEVGSESFSVEMISDDVMTWFEPSMGAPLQFVRESGDSGSFIGTWGMEDNGNLFTLTVNVDGTFTLTGQIYECDENGYEQDGVYITTNRNENDYWVDIRVVDNSGTITAVKVEGDGITVPVELASDNTENTRWVSWLSYHPQLHFENVPSVLPLTYSVNVTRGSETISETVNVNEFLNVLPQPVSPAKNADLVKLENFSFTGLGDGFQYTIFLFDENGQYLWGSNQFQETSISYTGPTLATGFYTYRIQANNSSGNGSFADVPFTVDSPVQRLDAQGMYDLANGMLSITSSNFLCDGPLEEQEYNISSITASSMTLTLAGGDGFSMDWVRTSGELEGAYGTWNMVGDSFSLSITQDNTFTLEGDEPECHAIEAHIWSNNYNGEFAIQMEVNDDNDALSEVTVEGYDIPVTVPLNHYPDEHLWASWGSEGELFSFGPSHPNPPLDYTLTFTWQDGKTFTRNFTINNFIEHVATPVSPLADEHISTLTEISWSRHLDIADNIISVDLYNDEGSRIWRIGGISGNSVMYTGPSLAPGRYTYRIKVWDAEGNSSKIKVPFYIDAAPAVEQSADGSYTYDSEMATLEISIANSSFICDGPVSGDVYNMEEVSITASLLTWTEIEDGQREVMSWSRVSAESDGLVGEWFHSEDGTGETLRFLVDGSVEIIGPDSSTCPEGTGAHSASGTYIYDPTKTTEQLSVEFVTSDFSCAGPEVGSESFTVEMISDDAMTWFEPSMGAPLQFVRESGDSGSFIGTWGMEDNGNLFTLTVNVDGTFTLTGQIYECDDNGYEQDGVYITTNRNENDYWVDIRVVDNSGAITAATVEGYGITVPVELASDNAENTRWVSWLSYHPQLHFENVPSALPLTYNVNVTRGNDTISETVHANEFLNVLPQPVSPAKNADLVKLENFSFTGLGDGFEYSISLFDENWQYIWGSYQFQETSISYTGPSLDTGFYTYRIQANNSSGNGSFADVPFTVGSPVQRLDAQGMYDLANGMLFITSSNFLCDGPLKEEVYNIISVTASSMTLTLAGGDGLPMNWVRTSGELEGAYGTWSMVGDSFSLSITQDNTFTLKGDEPECHAIEAHIWSNYYNGEFAIQMEVNDDNDALSNVTVEGYGITTPVTLNYYPDEHLWASWGSEGELFSFGPSHPNPPLEYTLTFTWQDGKTFTRNFTINNFIEHVATPVSPLANEYVNELTEISWSRHPDIADNVISVDLYDSSGARIWRAIDLFSNAVFYNGPSLTPGLYTYRIKVWDEDDNSSKIKVPFFIGVQPGNLNGRNGLDLGDAILALKVLTGQDAEEITSGALLGGDEKVGLDEAIYIINELSIQK